MEGEGKCNGIVHKPRCKPVKNESNVSTNKITYIFYVVVGSKRGVGLFMFLEGPQRIRVPRTLDRPQSQHNPHDIPFRWVFLTPFARKIFFIFVKQ